MVVQVFIVAKIRVGDRDGLDKTLGMVSVEGSPDVHVLSGRVSRTLPERFTPFRRGEARTR